MDRIFTPYTDWEDYQAGMYDESREGRSERVQAALECLSVPSECRRAMERVVSEWKTATDFNLTNKEQNRRAWLGQAACCIQHGCHEDETREAWGMMSDFSRDSANRIAQSIINEWERLNDGQMMML